MTKHLMVGGIILKGIITTCSGRRMRMHMSYNLHSPNILRYNIICSNISIIQDILGLRYVINAIFFSFCHLFKCNSKCL